MKTSVRLVVVLIVVFGWMGCQRSEGDRITKVLNRCAEVSRKAAAYNENPGAQAAYLAGEFQKIDVTRCPADFRMAFQAHIFAWQQAGPALGGNTLGANVLEGFVAGLTENPGVLGGANARAAQAHQHINVTYYELTQIAARYGARIPGATVGH